MQLNIEEAFLSMRVFLEKYYFATYSDDIGGLLGSTILLEAESTADPAAWGDWIQSVKKAICPQEYRNRLNDEEAYKSMLCFLEMYSEMVNSKDMPVLLDDMSLIGRERTKNPAYWNSWVNSINDIKRN